MLPRMPPTPVEIKREKGTVPNGMVKKEQDTAERGPPSGVTIKREPAERVPPSEVTINREPARRVRPALPSSPPPPPKALPPWAVKPEIVVKREEETVRIVPAVPAQAAPWSRPDAVPVPPEVGPENQGAIPTILPPPPSSRPGIPPGEKRRRRQPRLRPAPPPRSAMPQNYEYNPRTLKAANYAAVDPTREVYGLIDEGLSDPGTRSLIMHVRRKLPAFPVLEKIRPGGLLPAASRNNRGGVTLLRVRYTTPCRYFSPGSKVSSITVGVDEADWQSLVAKAHHI